MRKGFMATLIKALAFLFVILILLLGLVIGLQAASGAGSPTEIIRSITGTG